MIECDVDEDRRPRRKQSVLYIFARLLWCVRGVARQTTLPVLWNLDREHPQRWRLRLAEGGE